MTNYDIPNLFIQDTHIFFPAFLQGNSHYHYANLDEPIEDTDFADWKVGLFNPFSSTPVEVLGAPIKDIISAAAYRFYYTMNITASVTGIHYVAVYNDVTSALKFISNPFYVIVTADLPEWTFFEFRNSSNLDYFNYVDLPQSNSIFLPTSRIAEGFEYITKSVEDLATGDIRQQKSIRRKVITLETMFFDSWANDMMGSLSDHDSIIINGEPCSVKTGHESDDNRQFNLNSGKISFYVDRHSGVNYKL
jgi:hypothetical protein